MHAAEYVKFNAGRAIMRQQAVNETLPDGVADYVTALTEVLATRRIPCDKPHKVTEGYRELVADVRKTLPDARAMGRRLSKAANAGATIEVAPDVYVTLTRSRAEGYGNAAYYSIIPTDAEGFKDHFNANANDLEEDL